MMKTLIGKIVMGAGGLLLAFAVLFSASSQAFAQDGEEQPNDPRANEQMPGRGDGDLIRRLNLTPEQVRQIRQIRQQSAEEMRNSRQRMGRAQFALDEAIYADSVDESVVEARARDLATAQAAVARVRALTELRIRRLLTPEQLTTLRGIRSEAMQQQRDRERQRGARQGSAFQERRRTNEANRNQEGVKTNTPPASKEPASSAPGRP